MNKELSKTQPKKTINGAEALIKCLENFGVEYIWGLIRWCGYPYFRCPGRLQDQINFDPPRTRRHPHG